MWQNTINIVNEKYDKLFRLCEDRGKYHIKEVNKYVDSWSIKKSTKELNMARYYVSMWERLIEEYKTIIDRIIRRTKIEGL